MSEDGGARPGGLARELTEVDLPVEWGRKGSSEGRVDKADAAVAHRSKEQPLHVVRERLWGADECGQERVGDGVAENLEVLTGGVHDPPQVDPLRLQGLGRRVQGLLGDARRGFAERLALLILAIVSIVHQMVTVGVTGTAVAAMAFVWCGGRRRHSRRTAPIHPKENRSAHAQKARRSTHIVFGPFSFVNLNIA